LKFKIDENLPEELTQFLRKAGHDASTVIDQQLGGSSDMDIASACISEGRILITLDMDFANILTYPPDKFSGIIVLRTNNQAKTILLEFIPRILRALESEDIERRLWIVESRKIRIRGAE
jgi:predicted nuclease of predicted toxin-antitoxin system